MSKNRAQVAFGSPFITLDEAQRERTEVRNWIAALAKAQVASDERMDRIEAMLVALTAPKGPKAAPEAAPKEPKVAPKGPKTAPKGPRVKVIKGDWSPTAAQRAYYLANKAKFKKDREAYLAAKKAGLVA